MLKALSNWESAHRHLPYSYHSWHEIFGEKLGDFIGWILNYSGNNVTSVESDGNVYELKLWEKDYVYGFDSFAQCGREFPLSDVLELELDKEAFAREIAKAVGFERVQVEKLSDLGVYYLGAIALKSTFRVFLCYDLFHAEYALEKLMTDDGKTPIVYCFSERCLSNELRKMVDVRRGKIFKIGEHFTFGYRKLKPIRTLSEIFAYRGKVIDGSDTHTTWQGELPDIESRIWGNVTIVPDGTFFVKITYGTKEPKDERFSNIPEFRIGNPPDYKESALWKFFLSTLHEEGIPFDGRENSSDRANRKKLTVVLKRYFDISKPPYSLNSGRLYPNFNTKKLKTTDSYKIRYDKRRVSFDENYHSR